MLQRGLNIEEKTSKVDLYLVFRPFRLTPFGPVNISLAEDKKSLLQCVKCPFCHQTVDAKVVVKEGRRMIRCPECGGEAEL